MEPTPFATPDLARLLTLYARLVEQSGFKALTPATLATFVAEPGGCVLFFAEDPKRIPETWDVAVVLPDILRAAGAPLRVGLLDPSLARSVAGRYGVTLWPSLVFLRDGEYLGAIERMQGWDEFSALIPEILARAASRPPDTTLPRPADSLATH